MRRKIFSASAVFFLFTSAGGNAFSAQAQTAQPFFIDPSFDSAGRMQVQGDLLTTSSHAYWFGDHDFMTSLGWGEEQAFAANTQALAQEFDNRIYPLLRNAYGPEWLPGIDNDVRLTILLTKTAGTVGGYTRAEDEMVQSATPSSNVREMIYLNVTKVGSEEAKTIIAHEFTHLIARNQRERLAGVHEQTWLEEALAEYAPTLLGYNDVWDGSTLKDRVVDLQSQPFDSLLEWKGVPADGGSASLFMHYVVDRFGESILSALMNSPLQGTANVEQAVHGAGYMGSFANIFGDWAIANYINGAAKESDTAYRYINPQLNYARMHVAPLFTASVFPENPASFSLAVKDWEARWYRFVPGELGITSANVAKLEFETNNAASAFLVPYAVTDFFGNRSVQFMQLQQGKGTAYIPSFGLSNLSVSVAPLSVMTRAEGQFFYTPLTLRISLVASVPAQSFNHSDGTLIRAKGDTKVYVLTGGYRRWIQSPDIMNMYGQFRWETINEVTPEERDFYPESFLVRKAGDYRVYEVSASGKKTWLNMTAVQFEASGRRWDAIFTINEREFAWYR